jgi:hypothetical protein
MLVSRDEAVAEIKGLGLGHLCLLC